MGFFSDGVAIAFGLIFLVLPKDVYALEIDVYGGMGAGYSVQKQVTGDDTTDSSEKAYLGTRFLGPLGLELAYYNFGKYTNATEEVTATSAVVVLNLDIRGMTLFVKGGRVKWTETNLGGGMKRSGSDQTYGFGINLPVDRHVLFRTELEFFSGVGEDVATNDLGKDMWMLSFGVNFRF